MDSPPVIEALRRIVVPDPDDVSDADLLARFVASRDEIAFEALVRRHGRLVWGACRRRLRDAHSAEDAFQTTFLALARHASTVRRPEALAAWLHRVAVRCADEFRPTRYHMSASSLEIPSRGNDPATVVANNDLEQLIDAEIDTLPEPFRLAFVLCEVEQRTAADAAMALGCPTGTIESRLTRARKWLRARLARRGVTVGAMAGISFVSDAVPSSARAGALAMSMGTSRVPATLAMVADRVVRAGLGSMVIGIGLTIASFGALGLGGLIWMSSETSAPTMGSPNSPPAAVAVSVLPIPEAEEFRRNRDNFPLPPEAIARVGDPFLRHGAIPRRMAFSSDGRFLATGGSGDRWLRVWNLETNHPRAHFTLAAGETPAAVSLSSDGRTLRALILTGDIRAAQLREFDTFRGIETRRSNVNAEQVNVAVFTPDGKALAITAAGRLRVFDVTSASEMWRADISTAPKSVDVAISSDCKHLAAVVSGSDRIKLFDLVTGVSNTELVDSSAALSLPTLSADGRRLAVWCSTSQRIRVWDLVSRKLVFTADPKSSIAGLAITPDGQSVAGFSPSRAVMMWAIGQDAAPKTLNEAAGALCGRFTADSAVLAVATQAMTIQLVNVQTGQSLPGSPRDVLIPKPIGFATDGGSLLVQEFQSWLECSIGSDDSARRINPGRGASETYLVSAADRAAISPDHTLIARCTANRRKADDKEVNEFGIDLLDAATYELRGRIELEKMAQKPVFSPDGKIVYAVTADEHVRGWSVTSREEVIRIACPGGVCVTRLYVSPDGKYLATAKKAFSRNDARESIRLFDAHTGSRILSATGPIGEPRIAFSADGQIFAATTSGSGTRSDAADLHIWETATGRTVAVLPGLSGQPALSPDGRTLAVTHEDRVVLFELTTGQPRHEFRHHGKVEPALVWRADGRAIAAASPEAPVYLWDVAGDRTNTTPKWDNAADDARWSALCASDAAAAFQSLRQLWANPKEAIEFLRAHKDGLTERSVISRACEALEMIATPEAHCLLTDWAGAGGDSPLAREASRSLQRLLQI